MDLRVKSAITTALETLGLLRLSESVTRKNTKVIFTLHRVLPATEMHDCYNPKLAITPESLDDFLGFLKEYCPVLPLTEFLEDYGTRPGPYCALTFDDGWEDNHRFAFPILKKYAMPATVFLCTGLIGKNDSIPEETLWRISRNALEGGKGVELDSALNESLSLPPSGKSNLNLEDVHLRLKELPMTSKRIVLKKLEERFGMYVMPRPSLMDWNQVREMHGQGISFGSHTVSHAILPVEPVSDRGRELHDSKNSLQEQVPGCERLLAYPSGRFDAKVMRDSEEAGYLAAFTTMPGYAGPDTKNQSMPRISIDNAVVNNSGDIFSAARARLHILRRGRIGLSHEGEAY